MTWLIFVMAGSAQTRSVHWGADAETRDFIGLMFLSAKCMEANVDGPNGAISPLFLTQSHCIVRLIG